MKNTGTHIILILLFSTYLFASDEDVSWKLRLRKDGISVYSNPVPNSRIDRFKGQCVLDAPLEVVAGVMLDVASYPQWVADCVEARKFDCADMTTCRLYFTLAMPWPVRDRDVVLQSSTDIDFAGGSIIGSVRGLSEEIVPLNTKRVRITTMTGKWIFRRITADTTMATFICWADPAGYIPPFIVNAASADIPYRTLKGLQGMVKKEAYAQSAKSLDIHQLCSSGLK